MISQYSTLKTPASAPCIWMRNLKVWKDSHSMLRNPQSNTWSVEWWVSVISLRPCVRPTPRKGLVRTLYMYNNAFDGILFHLETSSDLDLDIPWLKDKLILITFECCISLYQNLLSDDIANIYLVKLYLAFFVLFLFYWCFYFVANCNNIMNDIIKSS